MISRSSRLAVRGQGSCLTASTSSSLRLFHQTSQANLPSQPSPSSTQASSSASVQDAVKEVKQVVQEAAAVGSEAAKATTSSASIAEADERLRQLLLDRDGGAASVPTRAGKWDQEMGRETARQMFRVLDQSRQNVPGTSTAQGEGASKHWSRRNY